MINQDFSEYPEHRGGFFKLLRAVNTNCFPGKIVLLVRDRHAILINCYIAALLNIPPQQFKLFMDSVIWAIKHTMRDIADLGLNCETLGLT